MWNAQRSDGSQTLSLCYGSLGKWKRCRVLIGEGAITESLQLSTDTLLFGEKKMSLIILLKEQTTSYRDNVRYEDQKL